MPSFHDKAGSTLPFLWLSLALVFLSKGRPEMRPAMLVLLLRGDTERCRDFLVQRDMPGWCSHSLLCNTLLIFE